MEEYVRSKRFSGMKANPFINNSKNAIKKTPSGRRKKKPIGDVNSKRQLSKYQIKTMEEFLKVRPGESKEKWLFRTRFRRIRTEEEIAATRTGQRKLKALQLNFYRSENRKKKSVPYQLWVVEKDFNFLKYYIFIINWAAIKFNISQQDLEMGFHFYENLPFTRDEFENKCRLFSNTVDSTFYRLKREGILTAHKSGVHNNGVRREIGLYKLSSEFVNILTRIYKKIAYAESFDFKPALCKTIPPELEAVIIEMAKENAEILAKRKEPQKIIIHGED